MPEPHALADLELDNRYPHGSNIAKKLTDSDAIADPTRAALIGEVAAVYRRWRASAFETAPSPVESFVSRQTSLYQEYRDFLDDPRLDVFDSRGALQPSALEEFCYFLFRPVLAEHAEQLAVGHHEVYQGLYFTSPTFRSFARLPQPNVMVGNLDFVIGKRVEVSFKTDCDEAKPTVCVAAVAVECKTYLDRPRYIESDFLAANIKRGFPRCLYIVLSEFLKLDLEKVNVFGSPIDKIYVLRRERNVDRSIRRAGGTPLPPIHTPAVLDFYRRVVEHLTEDWSAPEDWTASGILK